MTMYGEKELKRQRGHYHNMVDVAEKMVPRGNGPLSVKHALHEKKEEVVEVLGYEDHKHELLPAKLYNRFKGMKRR